MFWNIHIPDTPSYPQLYFKPPPLPQSNLGAGTNPAIATNVVSFSDNSSIKARCKELKKKEEELITILSDYEIRFQNAKQAIQERLTSSAD